jgi:hypothetical protein
MRRHTRWAVQILGFVIVTANIGANLWKDLLIDLSEHKCRLAKPFFPCSRLIDLITLAGVCAGIVLVVVAGKLASREVPKGDVAK